MTKYTLRYIDARGIAEAIRLTFQWAGVEYEDHRFGREEWPELKKQMPFGKCPVLDVDGVRLAESYAIIRYLCTLHAPELLGRNPLETAQIDAIADFHKDFFNGCFPFIFIEGRWVKGDLEKARQEFLLPAIGSSYPVLVRLLKQYGTGYFSKGGICWVDFVICEWFARIQSAEPSVSTDFPELVSHKARVHSHSKLREWIGRRPVTEF